MAYGWSEASGRFTDAQGRFVSEATVRAVVDAVADQASARLAAAAQGMLDGTKSLATFQAEAMQIIKTSHVATATIAHGGAESMTNVKYLDAAREIKAQYRYLAGFSEQVQSGAQKLDGSVISRSRMYGANSRVLYETIRSASADSRGLDECRNQTHSGETCSECRALSGRGWISTSEMPPIGSRICRSNCKCTLDRRRRPREVAA